MPNILRNRLLVSIVLTVLAYLAIASITPEPYVSSAMSLLFFMGGSFMFLRYVETAYRIVVTGLRSEAETGSHFAILGATLLSGGAMYSGLFGLIWVYFGQPSGWTATAVSSFGRGMMAAGFWLMFISPDAVDADSRFPMNFWRSVMVVFAIVIAFVAGTHFAGIQ